MNRARSKEQSAKCWQLQFLMNSDQLHIIARSSEVSAHIYKKENSTVQHSKLLGFNYLKRAILSAASQQYLMVCIYKSLFCRLPGRNEMNELTFWAR